MRILRPLVSVVGCAGTLCAAVLMGMLTPHRALADDATVTLAEGERVAVLPPGQEELLADMVGRGVALPGGCTMTAGEITGPAIHATYKCSTGEVVLELLHPDRAPRGATVTERFAIAVQRGSAPDGLVANVAERVRAREQQIEWKWLGTNVKAAASRRMLVIGGASLLGIALAVWAVTMRVKSRRS